MQLPGSQIDISQDSESVILKQQKLTKKIKYKGRSFADVVSDIQSFAYIKGFRANKKIVKFILLRIGLPDVDVFPAEDELKKEDIAELVKMLNTIESLKDRFLSPQFTEEPDEEFVNIICESEELAMMEPQPTPNKVASIWDDDTVTEMIYKFYPENLPQEGAIIKKEKPDGTEPLKYLWEHPEVEEVPMYQDTESEVSSHLKVLVLGEKGVGKQSVLIKSGFGKNDAIGADIDKAITPKVFSQIVNQFGERTKIDAWSLEDAIETNISREDFYAETGVLLIVYSIVDRRSFESIEFWATEASSTFLTPPPIVIAANKIDLNEREVDYDAGMEDPISWEEGMNLKNLIAERLGHENCAHPIEFVECSCFTGEGIEDVLNSILKLWYDNEKVVLPLVKPIA
jgi:GTPase SAR1 family protein